MNLVAEGTHLLLYNTNYYLTVLEVWSLKRVSLNWNQCVIRAAFLSGWSRGETVSLSFLAFRGYPNSLAHGPLLPFSKPAAASGVFTMFHHSDFPDSPLLLLMACVTVLSPPEKWRQLISKLESRLPCNITCSQVLGVGTGIYVGDHYCAYHMFHVLSGLHSFAWAVASAWNAISLFYNS